MDKEGLTKRLDALAIWFWKPAGEKPYRASWVVPALLAGAILSAILPTAAFLAISIGVLVASSLWAHRRIKARNLEVNQPPPQTLAWDPHLQAALKRSLHPRRTSASGTTTTIYLDSKSGKERQPHNEKAPP